MAKIVSGKLGNLKKSGMWVNMRNGLCLDRLDSFSKIHCESQKAKLAT